MITGLSLFVGTLAVLEKRLWGVAFSYHQSRN